MADIAFSDKAGSSNFTAGGDKRNQIFGDLLLNRTELEAYLTSLRRQQYSANPPANPNTGDLWRCSTTGATYTAGVLYRYSGTAWVQEIATALNVPNRNTVLQGSVSASGVPTLFEAGTGLACKLNATATPAIFAFMNGNSASTGAQDIIDGIAADSATFWSSLPINSTVYLFIDRSSAGVLSGGYTTLAPVTQTFAPAHSAGLQWVDFNTGKVRSSDGSSWTQRNRVYVGTATTNGTGVTVVSVSSYTRKINGVNFDGSADITVADGTKLPLAGGTMTGQLIYKRAANIASAATVNLSTATGNLVHITGNVTITAFTITAGQLIDVIFDSTPLLTHSAAILCPSGANIQVEAGDRCVIVGDAANVANIFNYQRANFIDNKSYAASFTRDMALASGTQVITGVGFKPRSMTAYATDTSGDMSIGSGTLSRQVCSVFYGTARTASDCIIYLLDSTATKIQGATIASFNDDGFTLTWTKTGSPTGTATVRYFVSN